MNKNKLIGRWRLFWGNCPQCNSDAPEMYECDICDYIKKYNNRTKKEDRVYWWGRFITKLKLNKQANTLNNKYKELWKG